MEFVGLLTAGISLARDIFSYVVVSKSHSIEQSSERTMTIVRERTVVHERVLDKEALQNILNDTNKHFARLLDKQTLVIVNEMRLQRIREVVQEVQARVNALKMLLNTESTDPQISMQLVISALNPLQVSLEVAKFRLQENGEQEAWQYCYLVGTSALISGYAYLKQDVSHLAEELETSIYGVQRQILNETAAKLITSKKEFPWERVPQLLALEGADELLELYNSATGNSTSKKIPRSYDVSKLSVGGVEAAVLRTKDTGILMAMMEHEQKGKSRVGVLRAIQARLKAVQK